MKKFMCTMATLLLWLSFPDNSAHAETKIPAEEDIIVIFESEKGKALEIPLLSAADIEMDYENIPAVALSVPAESVETLRNSPNVKAVYVDSEVRILEEKDSLGDIEAGVRAQGEDWGIGQTKVREAWKEGYTGKGVKVAVIDTGIDDTHYDLVVSGGVSFVDNEPWDYYLDENGHGTHVAGIIGAKNNGIAYVGAAPDVELYAVKVFDSSGIGKISKILAGVDWAITHDIDVINLSLGSEQGYDAYQSIFQKAYNQGIVVVAVAGNDFDGPLDEGGCASNRLVDCVDFPGVYNTTITVGATDIENQVAPFSSTGPSLDFVAPGVGIMSTYLSNQVARISGTSMAAPYVAGVVALLKEKYPAATPLEIKNLLIKNAMDVDEQGKDVASGYGLVQAEYSDIIPFHSKITTLASSNLYTEADVATKTSSIVSPQVVTAFERKGELFHIRTWLGDRWIRPVHYITGEAEPFEFKVKLLATERLYNYPKDTERTNDSLSPQTVQALRKSGDYLEIKTWLGKKWLKTTNYEKEVQVLDFSEVVTLTSRAELLTEANNDSKTGGSLSPQTVSAVRKTSDDLFYEINTWMGKLWIKPSFPLIGKVIYTDESIALTERKYLHEHPYSETKTNATVSPQTVRATASWTDKQGVVWVKIKTWIGEKWVQK